MCFKLSALLLVVILVEIVVTKQRLKTETTFGEESEASKTTIERNRQTEERINLSFPGTKWCGPGNTADGYDDLGSDAEIDKCCRQHDHCDNIPSGEEKHGLVNSDYFTRLHCMCDKEFKQCLRGANSRRGNYIGNFYFNVRDRCYKEQHPVVDCDEIHTKIFIRRCIKYMIDTMKPKAWQWFDLPFFDDEHDFEFDDPEAQDFVESNNLLGMSGEDFI